MLNEKQERAAELLSAGRKIPKVAASVGVDEKTVDRWKKLPEFAARIKWYGEKYAERILSEGAAAKNNRIAAKRRRIGALLKIVKERGAHGMFAEIPGGSTGYLTRKERSISLGDGQCSVVTDYALDKPLLDALRDLENDIAIEKGEWQKKVEHSGTVGLTASTEAVALAKAFTGDELRDMKARLEGVVTRLDVVEQQCDPEP